MRLFQPTTGRMQIVFFGLLLAALYCSDFSWLMQSDWKRDEYSYGWLVPGIIAYLLWEKHREVAAAPLSPSWAGLAMLLPGIALYWLGELAGEFFTKYLSFTLIVAGLCWLHLGWQRLKVLAFPLAMTLAMYPPPSFIHNKITFQLKLLSSQLGTWLLHLYGMPAYREGNIIDLGFTQLQVVDACSGQRYLFSLVIMAVLLAYFFRDRLWKKVVLVCSVIPLTLIINALRIAITGVLYEYWGAAVAEGFFHELAGIFIFMVGLGTLLLEMRILRGFQFMRRWRREPDAPTEAEPSAVPTGPEAEDSSPGPAPARSRWSAQFAVAALLLGATLALVQFVDFPGMTPAAKSFASFPQQIGPWRGDRGELEEQFVRSLDFSDYVMIDYRGPDNKSINFYVAYYQSQTKGKSIHSPETCLPGSGWIFEKAAVVPLPIASRGNDVLPVNSVIIKKDAVRQLSYYWFPQRDRIVTSTYALKLYNFLDALLRQRTDGALVRLVTPVYPDEQIEDTKKRLEAFTRELVPVLDTYLPQ
ncbi:MAG: VPLPA-CTERM-specific exosortase XrtD [Desulfobulbus sp.]|jgi:exosortase D (VPLPA-CTERM-specific)